jgi:hypothetical protein
MGPDEKDFHLPPDGRSRRLCVFGDAIDIDVSLSNEHAKARGSRQKFMQETQLFRHKFATHGVEAGHIAAWPVETRY